MPASGARSASVLAVDLTMRTFRHWTPRYIYNRLALMAFEVRHPDAPWLTATAIATLQTLIKPTDVGFEWGAGRSTRWFARRIAYLTSIESNRTWYDRVSQMLDAERLVNVELKWIKCDEADREEVDIYTGAIDAFDDASLDVVLVDGLARDACALRAVDKIRPGGLLIVDNCNWYLPCRSYAPCSRTERDGPASETWDMFLNAMRDWRYIWTSNGVTDTAVWFKP